MIAATSIKKRKRASTHFLPQAGAAPTALAVVEPASKPKRAARPKVSSLGPKGAKTVAAAAKMKKTVHRSGLPPAVTFAPASNGDNPNGAGQVFDDGAASNTGHSSFLDLLNETKIDIADPPLAAYGEDDGEDDGEDVDDDGEDVEVDNNDNEVVEVAAAEVGAKKRRVVNYTEIEDTTTGAMKLGKDAVVLTQTSTSRSVSFLSQSFNENKDNLEIPVVTYRKEGQYMEVDLTVQSEATAEYNLNAIKEFSPFNEYFIGEKLGLFGEDGTGTQVYIWNLDRWGQDYTLDWNSRRTEENPIGHGHGRGDILIRSKRVRSRPGQTSTKVPLDYSLQAYLEVMFRNPRMKITVQGSRVKARPLDKTLNKTSVISDVIMGKTIQLTLGRSTVEFDRTNCGVFLYWHGRLIESYKRVGGQKHNADTGRGVIGVADITELIDEEDGNSWVLNSKQGFQDCEKYATLEEWLDRKMDEYWDTNFESIELEKGGEHCKPDHEWVQCCGCRKWRVLPAGFNSESLPDEWFCLMPPFNGTCTIPEQQMGHGIITIGEKRSRNNGHNIQDEDVKNVELIQTNINKRKKSSGGKSNIEDDDFEGNWSQTESVTPKTLNRLRRGPSRNCKQ